MPKTLFARRWREAYERDHPVIEEAQRLAAARPDLAGDPYALFRAADALVAASAAFAAALAPATRRWTRRSFASLLASPP